MTGTYLCVRLYKSVPVIFEPPCIFWTLVSMYYSASDEFVHAKFLGKVGYITHKYYMQQKKALV